MQTGQQMQHGGECARLLWNESGQNDPGSSVPDQIPHILVLQYSGFVFNFGDISEDGPPAQTTPYVVCTAAYYYLWLCFKVERPLVVS